jgi:hypothetical protein
MLMGKPVCVSGAVSALSSSPQYVARAVQNGLHRGTRPNRIRYYLHGAEPLSRSRYSSTARDVMEPESSLPCSQEPSTCLYPETD